MRAGKGQQKHGKRRGDDHGCIDTSEQAATGTHAGEGQTGMDLRPDKHTHTHKLTHSQMPARTNSRAVDRGNESTRDDSSRKSMVERKGEPVAAWPRPSSP